MNRTLLTAVLALAPLVSFAAPVTYTTGDLLVGFRVDSTLEDATGGPGAGQSYLVDVGAVAAVRNASGPVVVAHLGSDLSATYGPDWFSRNDLFWGSTASPSNFADEPISGDKRYTTYVSAPEPTLGTPDPFAPVSVSSLKGVSTKLSGLQTAFKTATATTNNPAGTLQDDANATSWRSYMQGGQNAASADLNVFGEIETTPGVALSLYRIVLTDSSTTTSTYLGHLTLGANGDVTFTPGQTSNPSGYAAWALANVNGQGPTLDFDGDGISNGLEYFMGTAPNAATPHAVPSGGTVKWPRSATAVVTSFRVETSTDLVTWTNGSPNTAVTTTDITYTLPTGAAKTFVRLFVDVPEN